MSDRHFACTVVHVGDRTLKAGQVLNLPQLESYGDCTILGFSKPDQFGDVYVKVARPHVSVICVGTTSPSPVMQVEVFDLHIDKTADMPVVDTHQNIVGGVINRPAYDGETITVAKGA